MTDADKVDILMSAMVRIVTTKLSGPGFETEAWEFQDMALEAMKKVLPMADPT